MSSSSQVFSMMSSSATLETDSEPKEVVYSDSQFSVTEKVLAYHTNCLYQAKVLKVQLQMGTFGYYIHYLGWKKSWDEWVGADCLLKLTDGNIRLQKELNAKHSGEKKILKPGRASLIRHMNSSVPSGRKRKNDSPAKEEEIRGEQIERITWITDLLICQENNDEELEKLVHFHFPSTLKKQLVDDDEFIMHMGKLVKLPRKPNVEDILNKYLSYRSKKDGTVADTVEEILSGLRCYFDKSLPVMLLYKSEREQYQEATGDGASPATLYGAEHLLRLFVKLPEILYDAKIDEDTLKELQQKLEDILKFLQRNQSAFFLPSYQKKLKQGD